MSFSNQAGEATHRRLRMGAFWVVLLCGLFAAFVALAGCSASTPQEDAAADKEAIEEADEAAQKGEVDENSVHEMVCLPLIDYGMTDFFGQEYLWGVTIEDTHQVVVLHIGEGGIVDEEGNMVDEASLKNGDIIECQFDMIALSYPGQVSVDEAIFVREGGQAATEPYLADLEALKNSATDVANEVE